MCSNLVVSCHCGRSKANIMNKNNILPPEAVQEIYCPVCARRVSFDGQTMISDNGWIIKYNMPLIETTLNRLNIKESHITPETIFDKGYCSWNGITPTELEDRKYERAEILELAKIDMKRYLEELKDWGNRRMESLRKAGWRKARGGAF